MYGRIVLGVEGEQFDRLLDSAKEWDGVTADSDISADTLRRLCERYKKLVEHHTGKPFPQDPTEQLRGAIEAVFRSWNGPRAIAYRNREKISHDLGTAVNVQTMVFGNRDDNCGTGVGFTRDPSTGENQAYGDFLVNAQGEDVVAGIRKTEDLEAHEAEVPEDPHGAARPSSTGSRRTTATCATPSSRSTRASSRCCRRGSGSAPARPRCAWPSR